MRILTINPGATSTKIGYVEEEEIVYQETIAHSVEKLQVFDHVQDQLELRLQAVLDQVHEWGLNLKLLDGIGARGGLLPPVQSGAYEINQAMLDYLMYRPRVEHASNLGALLAEKIRAVAGKKTRAFVYDPVTVDEFPPVARISGLKGMERESIGHALNMRAVAREVAENQQRTYEDVTYIVAHLGGGNSISLHHQGRMVDLISDDEGPFSTERTGELPVKQVIAWCYDHSQKEMMTHYRKQGGVLSYLGTNDAREVEKRIAIGDEEASLVYEAMAYQISKGIGSLAPIVAGKVEGIIMTGGLAYSDVLMAAVEKQVAFIAPVYRVPGERELMALAKGVARVLRGEELSHQLTC
ncbi:butyrate kinase [Vagococcus sp. BWB3-3]|uniref:Probable butyrate kinase n=1 Tax=Vagococcus allomyrinae TaxID=2794353 RepID=A0A940PAM0_9ENTE|nr:butyrate kinase [Vagococcus allomyrinae]MBP1039921.1 butyrate kinase [Vagococcus allomyrinae]